MKGLISPTPPILIAGQGSLADEIALSFRRAGRRARWLDDLASDAAQRALRKAATLILAAEESSSAREIEQVRAGCRLRPRRASPLRLILVREQDRPTALPTLPETAPLRLQAYSVELAAARALLARWPLHTGFDPAFGQGVHVLVAGTAPPAQALILQTLRLMHYGTKRPALTLASEAPEQARDALLAAYPQAPKIAELRFVTLAEPLAEGAPPVTGVYVCMVPSESSLDAARRLASAIRARQRVAPAVHIEVGAAEPAGQTGDWDGQMRPFSYRRDALHPEVLLDGRGDELARTIHEHYRDSIAAQDRDPDAAPAGQPWPELDESYRLASRHQADHLWAKLALCDCRAMPEDLVEIFTFSPLEVERLAEIEHDRWAADRLLEGWAYGPKRDDRRRLHPQLVPYAELSEAMKDLDRFAVRITPILLARYGRGLVRMLIVGAPEPRHAMPASPRLRRLVARLFARLVARYPDRSLVLATTLAGSATRAIARCAIDDFGAGLFVLSPEPPPDLAVALTDSAARHEHLELLAAAERHIALPQADALDAWYAQRAEILVGLGPDDVEPVASAAKPVRIDVDQDRLHWGFEY